MSNYTGLAPNHQEAIDHMAAERAKAGWPLVTWGEFKELPISDIRWLMEGVLTRNGVSQLLGSAKAGKSTWARCLATCVSGRRDSFLGRKIEHGKVLHLSLEESQSTLKAHYQKLDPLDNNLILTTDQFNRPSEKIGWLENVLSEDAEYRLVIVDTLWRFFQSAEINDYALMTAELEPLIRLARRRDCHIMVVHHKRKGDPSFGDEALGSSGIGASHDTTMLLTVDKTDERQFKAYGRDDAHFHSTPMYYGDNGWVSDDETPGY